MAIITGGAGLLGEQHAMAIAEYGAIPILIDIDKKNGLKKSINISKKYKVDSMFIHCDITDEKQILAARDKILKKHQSIQILINNAAIDPKVLKKKSKNLSRLEYFDLNQWNKEIAVGLTGAMLASKIFGYEMSKLGKGVILNISSDLGIIPPNQSIYKVKGYPQHQQPVKPVTYSVIKHGLIGLTKYLSTYWADKGVRCNALCPGGVYDNQDPSFVEQLTNLIPLGRMAHLEEYKASIVFLVSDASSYMNGSSLLINGGRKS